MESYIEDKRNLYASIHEFLDESDEHNENGSRKESLEKLINIYRSQQIEGDVEEMLQFLEIIKSIGENHHRDQQFNEGMNQLLFHFKDQIKQTLSNSEIFRIFENDGKLY